MSSLKDDTNVSTELRRGPWTLEEDQLLIKFIANHGEGRWNMLANRSGLKRTGKSCRLRWLNYLKPDVKRGNLSPKEQLTILELHSKWGNRWSRIAQNLPGRTDNEIKNYWRTRVQKQAKHLKIDSNSREFLKVIRLLWMPHKDEGSLSSSLAFDQNYQTMPAPSNQYSHSASPTQISLQADNFLSSCMYGGVLNLDRNQDTSAGSINATSQISGYPNPISQLQGMCNSESSTIPDGNAYSIDRFNTENSNTNSAADDFDFEFTVGGCQVTQSMWINKDFSEYLQGADDFWQI